MHACIYSSLLCAQTLSRPFARCTCRQNTQNNSTRSYGVHNCGSLRSGPLSVSHHPPRRLRPAVIRPAAAGRGLLGPPPASRAGAGVALEPALGLLDAGGVVVEGDGLGKRGARGPCECWWDPMLRGSGGALSASDPPTPPTPTQPRAITSEVPTESSSHSFAPRES
jgi:hypothetical protein